MTDDLLRTRPGDEFGYAAVGNWCQSLSPQFGSFITYQVKSEAEKQGLNWIYVLCVLGNLTSGFTDDRWDKEKRAPILTGGWTPTKFESWRFAVRHVVNQLKEYATASAVPNNTRYLKLYADCRMYCVRANETTPPDPGVPNSPPPEPEPEKPKPPSSGNGKTIANIIMAIWIAVSFVVPLPGYVKAIISKILEAIAGSL